MVSTLDGQGSDELLTERPITLTWMMPRSPSSKRTRWVTGDGDVSAGKGSPSVPFPSETSEPVGTWDRLTTVRLHRSLVFPLLLLAACGDAAQPVDASAPSDEVTEAVGEEQRYAASTMVLESPDHGPQLCLGGSQDSYPPQCGGPDVVGWDWDEVEEEEAAFGTTWGDHTVVGTWDGERLTLTEPPGPSTHQPGLPLPDTSTPCPPPPGGWVVVDETKLGGQGAAFRYADAQADYAGGWLDHLINPASAEPISEAATNEPATLVLNLRFTGDLARHEAEVRKVWGGALCVTEGERTVAELSRIQRTLGDELDLLFSVPDQVVGVVFVGVTVEEPGLQDRLDERYGEGVVEIIGSLRPVS